MEELCLTCKNKYKNKIKRGIFIFDCSACDSDDKTAIEYWNSCDDGYIPDWQCPSYIQDG